VPTNTQRDNHPQASLLSAVRESQTAFVDVVRSWTDITEYLARRVSLPVAGIDLAGAVDRTFDLAEQTLSTQRQFALTFVGAVDRQVDTVVGTVESSAHQSLREVEGLLREAKDEQPQPAGRQRSEQPTAAKAEAPTDELIAALREQRQPKQPKGDANKAAARTQDSKIDRRPFAERSLEELRDRARELRSTSACSWTRRCPDGWTSGCETASSPSREATRSRCSNCRVD
jgi:hypothetical protein